MPGRTTRERLRTEITDIAKVDSGMAKLVTALLFIAALGVGFFGGPVLIVVAIALDRSRPMLWWLLAALVLILATIAITFGFHVPLNYAIKAAGNPDGIDVAQVRDDFRESWWRGWNMVRCVTATAAAACLMWALVLHARAADDTPA